VSVWNWASVCHKAGDWNLEWESDCRRGFLSSSRGWLTSLFFHSGTLLVTVGGQFKWLFIECLLCDRHGVRHGALSCGHDRVGHCPHRTLLVGAGARQVCRCVGGRK
jgi:hypothetical protein